MPSSSQTFPVVHIIMLLQAIWRAKRLLLGVSCIFVLSVLEVCAAPLADLTPWKPWLNAIKSEEKIDKEKSKLAALRDHDLTLLIDKSSSMRQLDCERVDNDCTYDGKDKISRWDWCKAQIGRIVEKSADFLQDGVRIVLFSSRTNTFDGVDARGLSDIFAQNKPEGGTETTKALRAELESYFARKTLLGDRAKPLLIAIVSDSCPNDSFSLRREIAKATKRMTRADELSIAFLQVGNDYRADELFEGLRKDMQCHRGQYDIVTIKTFDEVTRLGLATALAEAISATVTSHAGRVP